MPTTLEVKNLAKSYGAFQAVKGLSFSVKKGEIFALIGPNGAGKSTTLRMIATLLSPSSGTITVGGFTTADEPGKVREVISYLPEEAGAYKNLKGLEYLRFMAGLYASDRATQEAYVAKAVEISGLGDKLKNKIGTYSKGMTRKLLISRAVMSAPQLVILDEPSSGLDIINAREIRNQIRELAAAGTSVLLSSHNMFEIEYLSDRMGIIYGGTLHDVGTAEELKKKYGTENLEDVFIRAIA